MRMRTLAAAVALVCAAVFSPPALAQQGPPSGAYPYEDAGAEDPAFTAFRAQLIRAVRRRDVEAVMALSSEEIFLGFGGDAGRADFRRILGDFPELWHALTFALQNGSWRTEEGYSAPYWFSMPTSGDYDPYTTAFVPARDVVVRDGPSRDAQGIAAVTFGFVAILPPFLGPGEGDYQRVRTANGVEGFMAVEFIESVIGYRAGFSRRDDGAWEMRFFLAGD